VVVSVFAACSPISESGRGEQATFLVDRVSLEENQNTAVDPTWNLPTEKTLTFKACVSDVAYLQPVIDQTFEVQVEAGTKKVKTDKNGCLYWSEQVAFNYLQRETFVEWERTIQASGVHRGSQTVDLAVNPWKTGKDAAVGVRVGSPPGGAENASSERRGISALLGGGAEAPSAHVVVGKVGFQIIGEQYSPQSSRLRAQLLFDAALVREGIAGAVTTEVLQGGRFGLRLWVIEVPLSGGAKEVLFDSGDVRQPVTFKKGRLELETDLILNRLPNRQSTVEIAFELVPEGAPGALGSDQGVVQIAGLKLPGTPLLTRLDKPVSEYVSQLQPKFETLTPLELEHEPGDLCQQQEKVGDGFIFDRFQIMHGGIASLVKGDHVPMEIELTLTACMKSSIDLKPIVHHPFRVKLAKNAEDTSDFVTKWSDSDGCIYWKDRFDFDFYAPEQYLPRYMVVQSEQAPYLNIRKALKVFIDPWRTNETAWDCRRGAPPVNPIPKPAELQLASLIYQFIGRDLDLDRYMNLKVKRKYMFRLSPIIQHAFSFNQGPVAVGVKDGCFNVRFLLLASPDGASFVPGATSAQDPLGGFKYLASYEPKGPICARDGTITEIVPFEFDFQELPQVAARNQLVIEVSPVDARSKLKSFSGFMPFIPIEGSGWLTVFDRASGGPEANAQPVAADVSVKDLIQSGKKLKFAARNASSPLQLFREMGKVVAMDQKKLAGQLGVDAGSLEFLIMNPSAEFPATDPLKAKFCRLVYEMGKSRTGMAEACAKNPKEYLNFQTIRHVEKVVGQPKELRADTLDLSVTAAFAISDGEGTRFSTGENKTKTFDKRINISGNGKVPVFPGLDIGVSAGTGWSWSHSWYTSTSTDKSVLSSNGISVAQIRTLRVEEVEVAANLEVRNCMLAGSKQSFASNTVHVCLPNTETVDFQDFWYYIAQNSEKDMSYLRDNPRLTNRPWTKVIRGQRIFTTFADMMRDESKTFLFVKEASQWRDPGVGESDVMTRAYKFFYNYMVGSDNQFPGLID